MNTYIYSTEPASAAPSSMAIAFRTGILAKNCENWRNTWEIAVIRQSFLLYGSYITNHDCH